MESDGPRASTTDRVARVLLALGAAEGLLGVSELARATDLSKAVVHRILQTLMTSGLVAFDLEQRRYRLGPAAVALGRRAERENELRHTAMPLIAHLAEVSGETTTISARVGHSRIYIGQVESRQLIRISITIGQSVPLTAGASGLAMLAFLQDEDIDLALQTPVRNFTERTEVDPKRIAERLALIRDRGWADSEGERVYGSSSIAAPVFDAAGDVAGSLSLAYLASRMSDQERTIAAGLVVDAAHTATTALRNLYPGTAVGSESARHSVPAVGQDSGGAATDTPLLPS